LFTVRIAFLVAVRSKLFVRRVAVLGPAGEVAGALAALRSARDGFFEVVATRRPAAPVPMRAAGIRIALLPQAAFDAMTAADRDAYARAGIAVEPEPVFWERQLRRIDIDHLTTAWFDRLDAEPGWTLEPALIRAGDIAISLGLLVFTLPLMLLVSLLVRLDSPGPVLYRQERVGLGGKTFTLLKFRSMKTNAEARGPAWAQRGDPRVTRVGSFMRRTRIDELPQLINVLRGEMGFIGPRPERPHFVEQLALLIPHYRERARVKPGLTGWAQVNYPYGASVEDARAKLSYDLFYVRNRGMLLDLSILCATVRVILFQEGAR
jgi:exopolysaccharide biosynthesis polyprenyl glycosylphosphotransferase